MRQLAMRREPPTPDNYRALYHEIAGTAAIEAFPERAPKTSPPALAENHARAAALRPAVRGGRQRRQLGCAAWKAALTDLLARGAAAPPNWSGLIRDLVSQ
ncbi:MAG: hypothetical protein IPG52_15725 [Rhodocyclaceae bacterium]|nr:hypothetical protein [Rhodocyclaceae bacterium]